MNELTNQNSNGQNTYYNGGHNVMNQQQMLINPTNDSQNANFNQNMNTITSMNTNMNAHNPLPNLSQQMNNVNNQVSANGHTFKSNLRS